jgi:hypothetical protein
MTVISPRATVPKTPLPAGLTTQEQLAQRYDRLLELLADQVVKDAIGTDIPAYTRLADTPQSRLWLGMLSSEPQLVADQLSGRGFRGKLVPPGQGFSFRVATVPVSLEVTVSAAYYLALHPTVDEQRHAVTADVAADNDPATTGDQRTGSVAHRGLQGATPVSQQGYKLAPVWSKSIIEPVTLTVNIDAGDLGSRRLGAIELAAALATAGTAPMTCLTGPPGPGMPQRTCWTPARFSLQCSRPRCRSM